MKSLKAGLFRITLLLILFSVNSYSQSHSVMWGARYTCTGVSIDSAVGIVLDVNGNAWITGSTKCYPNVFKDIVVLKYNSLNGNLFCAPILSGLEYDDFPRTIKADNNYVYVCGVRYFPFGNRSILIFKYNLDCSLANMGVFDRNGGDYGNDMAIDGSGNIYVAGRGDTTINSVTTQRFLVVKFNPSCSELWRLIYVGSLSGTFDEAQSVKVDGSGNVYVTGFTSQGQTNYDSYDYLTLKLNTNGAFQWAKRFNGVANKQDFAVKNVLDNSYNSYVTGYSYTNVSTIAISTIKYSPNGDSLAFDTVKCVQSTSNYPTDMAIDNASNVYITGYGQQCNSSSSLNDYVTIKYTSSLARQWVRSYNGTGNGNDYARSIAVVNRTGNVYVTGTSFSSTEGNNYLTLQYSSNGNLLWTQPTHFSNNDIGVAIALDSLCEKVFITGYVDADTTANHDIYTVAYGCIIGIQPISGEVPSAFQLFQNYPNPFNPTTSIIFDIPIASNVKLTVYDILGREIAVPVNQKLEPGRYQVDWDGKNYASGMYFYRLAAMLDGRQDYVETKRMVMVK